MNTELKQFLYDQARLKKGLPPQPLPFSRHPKPAWVSPDPVPDDTKELKVEAPRPRKLSPSKIRRHTAFMAKHGRVFTPEPPTKEELYKRQPQLCRECGNKWAGRVLLPPTEGKFFNHGGLRWICHPCINGAAGKSATSPGENRLRDLLREAHIKHTMQARIEGAPPKMKFDCHIPQWNLIVEVDSWSAHHTASQKKKDHHRNKVAERLGIHLLRVRWDDPEMLVKVVQARKQGFAMRRKFNRAKARKKAFKPYLITGISGRS